MKAPSFPPWFHGQPDERSNSRRSQLLNAYTGAKNAVRMVQEFQSTLRNSKHLTDEGVTARTSALVQDEKGEMGSLVHLRKLRGAVAHHKVRIRERLAELSPVKPSETAVEELRRQEIRRFLLEGNNLEAHNGLREAWLDAHVDDPTVTAAVLGALPELSGVVPSLWQSRYERALEDAYPEELPELRDDSRAVDTVSKAIDFAEDVLREAAGLKPRPVTPLGREWEKQDHGLDMTPIPPDDPPPQAA